MPEYRESRGISLRRAQWVYGGDVGTVEVAVPNDHLVYDPDDPRGTRAGKASPAVFRAYAQRLLEETANESR